jgi:microcystin degradation protein MlrC
MKFRVAVAGMHIESGTFSPLRSRAEDFLTLRGDEMRERYPFLACEAFDDVELVPLVHFRAMPGGCLVAADYARMKGEIIERLRDCAEGLDAFYFDVHGALTVEGLEDAEADLLDSIRAELPSKAWVTCSQDLHGNVSEKLWRMTDVMTTYRTAPHVDWMETRERALALLLRGLRAGRKPHRAYVSIPVIVSGEMSSTEYEPGKSLYAPLAEKSQQAGIWDASLWVGYAWADQERVGAAVVVIGDEADAVKHLAESIAQRYWEQRENFTFITEAAEFSKCWQEVLADDAGRFFLSDAGDNPTAGGAGDVTDTLARVLQEEVNGRQKKSVIFASIPDAAALRVMQQAGVGSVVTVFLGGKLDPLHGREIEVTGEVRFLLEGENAQGVLRVDGVDVIVSEKRRPYHLRADFLKLGLDPECEDVTIVKIGYLEPELKAMARRHMLVLSAGGVRADFWEQKYEKRRRPLFPFERDFSWEPEAKLIFG